MNTSAQVDLIMLPPDGALPDGTCGTGTHLICEWTYERTGNAWLATATDWLVGRPLAVLLILAAGWVLRYIIRRVVNHGVNRMMLASTLVPTTTANVTLDDEELPDREEARRVTRSHAVASAVSSALSGVVWAAVVVSIAGVLGLELGPILASAGLAGVAIAFGAQSLVRDFLAGITILLEDHFGIGDEVDFGRSSGVVEKMTLRQTVLRDLEGTVWHVPNGLIESVGNQSQVWSATVVDVTLAHGQDIPLACALLAEVGVETGSREPFVGEVLGEPEVLGVEELTANGITVRLVMRTLAGRQFALKRALLGGIEEKFRIHGVTLAHRRPIV